jgi:hypothetical protein
MARKRRKAKTRSVSKSSKYTTRRKSTGSKVKLIQPYAMGYGAVRSWISSALDKVAPNIPVLSQVMAVSDELVIGGINWYAAKKGKGIVKKLAMDGLVVENARAGETIRDLVLSRKSAATTTGGW